MTRKEKLEEALEMLSQPLPKDIKALGDRIVVLARKIVEIFEEKQEQPQFRQNEIVRYKVSLGDGWIHRYCLYCDLPGHREAEPLSPAELAACVANRPSDEPETHYIVREPHSLFVRKKRSDGNWKERYVAYCQDWQPQEGEIK